MTFVEGSEYAYLGFCTVRYIEPPLDPMRVGNAQHLCSALVVNAYASPVIEHCSFSSTCSGLYSFFRFLYNFSVNDFVKINFMVHDLRSE